MRKYEELMREIERRMEDGTIRGGQRLPSIRDMSERFACSKSTVIRAFAELEKRHLVYTVPQSGYYAVVQKPETERNQDRALFDFSAPSPDPEHFPYTDFQHCLNKAIDMYRSDLFAYGLSQGLPSLQHVLSKHLNGRQVFVRPERITVTSGMQQALAILSELPFPNGKRTVLLEQPSYHLLIRLLETKGIPVRGINRSEQGIDLDRLEQLFRTGDIKLFYTMPRFHNPLGTSYPETVKKAIAGLAERYGVYVMEDDYLADLETDPKSDPIYAYAPSHVIYLNSFSKLLFPGLRIGAVVLPPELQDTFGLYKQLADLDSPMLSQAALEIYMQNGMFERRKQQLVASYHDRMLRLNRALHAFNDTGFAHHASVQSGAHTHIAFTEPLHIPTLLNRLRRKNVVLRELDSFFLCGFEKRPLLKLSIARVGEDRIEEGVWILMDEIKRMKRTIGRS
ncbi:PLP-dependent aminotransferase family protein [Paenibacillus thalictri]|uniref:PLP-dependent aminotransferase family protein n=1 Tax=Paenibacillus thalictri TaxID=2527873 RepID=A0A4Q9DGR6_9BACL|nr:PLP-dependent aminotransferase family protein [Paenibacillus thalictri]TBL71444.1 PLP-dependent aminotransferase family protein [Paenibacillus thalictri]